MKTSAGGGRKKTGHAQQKQQGSGATNTVEMEPSVVNWLISQAYWEALMFGRSQQSFRMCP